MPVSNEAKTIIKHLSLLPHPEGGWYREVYRCDEIMSPETHLGRYKIPHCFSTSIYFLLETNDFSAFHRISSDETWHFYLGSSVTIYYIDGNELLNQVVMGSDFTKGQVLQYTVPKNTWFAAKTTGDQGFCLVGCTVSPGFEFSDFELGQREKMLNQYPQYKTIISYLTR